MEDRVYSKPPALKVWGGRLDKGCIQLDTSAGSFVVSYDLIRFISVGQVVDRFDRSSIKAETLGKAAKKMIPLMGAYVKSKEQNLIERDRYLSVIIFADGFPGPFRFDNRSTNFRKFLGDEATHTGHVNLFRCLSKIMAASPGAAWDDASREFLETGRLSVRCFGNLPSFLGYAWKEKEKAAGAVQSSPEENNAPVETNESGGE